jgi:hypothetical protein
MEKVLNIRPNVFLTVDSKSDVGVITLTNPRGDIIGLDNEDLEKVIQFVGANSKFQGKEFSETEVITLLENFGNYILDNARLHDIGGKLRKDKAKEWLKKNR